MPIVVQGKRAEIVKETLRRFPDLPQKTVARFLIDVYGPLFDGDMEKARSVVRFYCGKSGTKNRDKASDKSLYRKDDKPVSLPPTWRKTRNAYKLPPGYYLVLSDAHIPFHEPVPLEAAIAEGKREKVTGILLNGDWMDCAAVSYWPTAKRDFDAELEAVADSLDFLRGEFPKANIVYKPGNHEYRLPRYFVSHAPELAQSPLSAMDSVLGLESRDIEFLDYHQIVMAGDLPIIHGNEIREISRAVNPARGLFLKIKTFGACSHCHSTSMHTPRTIHGDLLTTWSFGCLCDLNPDYNPYGTDWNWGFALVNVEPSGSFEVINRRVLKKGKVV